MDFFDDTPNKRNKAIFQLYLDRYLRWYDLHFFTATFYWLDCKFYEYFDVMFNVKFPDYQEDILKQFFSIVLAKNLA